MAFKKSIIPTIAIVLLVMAVFFLYIDFGKQQKYEDTLDYLMNNQEYYESDMKSIIVKYSVSGIWQSHINEWTIQVVFNDEPKARYYYHVNGGKIIQSSYAGTTENDFFMHSEREECND